jgi:hypothetical protein
MSAMRVRDECTLTVPSAQSRIRATSATGEVEGVDERGRPVPAGRAGGASETRTARRLRAPRIPNRVPAPSVVVPSSTRRQRPAAIAFRAQTRRTMRRATRSRPSWPTGGRRRAWSLALRRRRVRHLRERVRGPGLPGAPGGSSCEGLAAGRREPLRWELHQLTGRHSCDPTRGASRTRTGLGSRLHLRSATRAWRVAQAHHGAGHSDE